MARVDRRKKDYLEGLWAYWSFEDPTTDTIYDQSGNERDGTGSNLEKTEGILGDAYWFNGENSGISIPSDIAVLPDVPISACLWLYSPEYPGHTIRPLEKIHDYRETTPFRTLQGYTFSFGFQQDDTDLYFVVARAEGDVDYVYVDAIYGRWAFICGVWDGETIKLFIDGKLKAEKDFSGSLYQEAFPLYIGRGYIGYYFYGKIDEVMIFEKALTETEVRKLYEIYKRERQKVKVRVV